MDLPPYTDEIGKTTVKPKNRKATTMFINPTTNRAYSGNNVQALETHQAMNNLESPYYAGYKQWLEAGRVVKKGAKGCTILFFPDKNIKDADGKTTGEKQKIAKGRSVFNIDQTEAVQ